MVSSIELESDCLDKERAESEGMGKADRQPSQEDPTLESLLKTPEFLDLVVKEFYTGATQLATIEEGADDLVKRLALTEFEKALEKSSMGKLEENLRRYMSRKDWEDLQEEELDRQIFADKTLESATPG